MGDSEEGGGGSVDWKFEAKNASKTKHEHEKKAGGKQEIKQEGNDEDGALDTDFTVTVRVPENVDPDEFLQYLKDQLELTNNRKRVFFNHPILQNRSAQIRVSWGESSNHEGNGGKPTEIRKRFPNAS